MFLIFRPSVTPNGYGPPVDLLKCVFGLILTNTLADNVLDASLAFTLLRVTIALAVREVSKVSFKSSIVKYKRKPSKYYINILEHNELWT